MMCHVILKNELGLIRWEKSRTKQKRFYYSKDLWWSNLHRFCVSKIMFSRILIIIIYEIYTESWQEIWKLNPSFSPTAKTAIKFYDSKFVVNCFLSKNRAIVFSTRSKCESKRCFIKKTQNLCHIFSIFPEITYKHSSTLTKV